MGTEEDPIDLKRIVEEFIRLYKKGEVSTIEEFTSTKPAHLRDTIEQECRKVINREQVLEGDADSDSTRGLIGERLGDFQIIKEIGQGSFGVVYLAEQVSLKRRVALKVLARERTLSAHGVKRFQLEAESEARLSHPGIVAVIQYGTDAGVHYLAMEYIPSLSLHEVLENIRRAHAGEVDLEPVARCLNPEDHAYPRNVARVIGEIADALDYAHGHGVVHRDIKPRNILIDAEGHPHVIDFGLAKLIDEESLSQTGDIVGTYYYMSPEQALAKQVRLDHRTDIFSLGVVMYELLTLQRPFEGSDSHAIIYEISFTEPKSPHRLNRSVPRDLEVICGKAMEKSPSRRFATAGEMAKELDRVVKGESIVTRPPGFLMRAWRRTRRYHVAAGTALLFVTTLLAVAILLRPPVGGTSVRITAGGHDGATVWYRMVDPCTGSIGDKQSLGTAPVETNLPEGYYRFLVEVAGVGFAELSRYVQEREGLQEIEARWIIATAEVTGAGMVNVPAGEFIYSPDSVAESRRLDEFWIDAHEVSNEDYLKFVDAVHHRRPRYWPEGRLLEEWRRLPVTGVSQEDARAYAEWAGKRLATDLEWARASRGTEGWMLPWKREWIEEDPFDQHANVLRPSLGGVDMSWELYLASVVPVDEPIAGAEESPSGLLHTLGNVAEWTDTIRCVPFDGVPRPDPTDCWIRGGSWSLPRAYCRLNYRYRGPGVSNHTTLDIGFRCAKSADPR